MTQTHAPGAQTANPSVAAFMGDIPRHYDEGLGPVMFPLFADDLAERVARERPGRVLELAAGTGILSRRLLDALPNAELTVTDLNAPMLEIAKGKLPSRAGVRFEVADALGLPFASNAFDAVVVQFGVMFYPDKDQGHREAFRVLAPGGRYLFNAFDAPDRNPIFDALMGTMERLYPGNPPTFFRVPCGYSDTDAIRASLEAAGFGDVSITVVEKSPMIGDVQALARGFIQGNPVAVEIEARGGQFERDRQALAQALSERFGPTGPLPLRALVAEAVKPR